jgi:hypothetical protein
MKKLEVKNLISDSIEDIPSTVITQYKLLASRAAIASFPNFAVKLGGGSEIRVGRGGLLIFFCCGLQRTGGGGQRRLTFSCLAHQFLRVIINK